MLLKFDAKGTLPPGIHAADWPEFAGRFGFSDRRRRLLRGLNEALRALQEAGCQIAYVDGSFVTAKKEPGDFDACWGLAGVDPDRLDPVLLDFSNGRAAQKARYGGELFPAELPEGLSGRTFLDFFQTDRDTGAAKGIVSIDLSLSDLSLQDFTSTQDFTSMPDFTQEAISPEGIPPSMIREEQP